MCRNCLCSFSVGVIPELVLVLLVCLVYLCFYNGWCLLIGCRSKGKCLCVSGGSFDSGLYPRLECLHPSCSVCSSRNKPTSFVYLDMHAVLLQFYSLSVVIIGGLPFHSWCDLCKHYSTILLRLPVYFLPCSGPTCVYLLYLLTQ